VGYQRKLISAVSLDKKGYSPGTTLSFAELRFTENKALRPLYKGLCTFAPFYGPLFPPGRVVI